MSSIAMKFQWSGEAMIPLARFVGRANEEFVVGEFYVCEVIEERSQKSHGHYFAVLNEIWRSLPDHLAGEFPDVEHLRKRALIETGHFDQRQIATSSPAEARKWLAFLKPMDAFAVYAVHENIVVERKAKSQSKRAMGAPTFQKSKTDVLDWASALIGVNRREAEKVGVAA